MYGVKASESSTMSGSLASRTTTDPTGYQTGKKALNGPSGLMLRQYYRSLLILTGDLNAGNIGPYADKGDNDVGLLQDFANSMAGTLNRVACGSWAAPSSRARSEAASPRTRLGELLLRCGRGVG